MGLRGQHPKFLGSSSSGSQVLKEKGGAGSACPTLGELTKAGGRLETGGGGWREARGDPGTQVRAAGVSMGWWVKIHVLFCLPPQGHVLPAHLLQAGLLGPTEGSHFCP